MHDILTEILEAIEERQLLVQKKNKLKEAEGGKYRYKYNDDLYGVRGKTSKAYITRRIDMLREKLLEEKKKLK